MTASPAGPGQGRLALVTVTYNSAPVLEDFLASLDVQTSADWDLIVVDNASADASVAMLERWTGPLCALVRNSENVGFGAATNQGIRIALAAGYDGVVIINNDVTFAADFIARLATSPARDGHTVIAPAVRYHAHPDRFWYAGGDFTWVRGAFQARMLETPPKGSRASWAAEFAPGCCLLVERATLERVGLFDEQFFVYWEDVDWAYRCRLLGQPITVVREPTLYHKVSVLTGGGSSPFGARMFYEGQIRFLRKHFPRWLQRVQYPLILAKIALRSLARRDRWSDTRMRLRGVADARRIPRAGSTPIIGVNLTAVGSELIGGTPRYAVSLFEAMAKQVADGRITARLDGYVRPGAERHFSPTAQRFLVRTPPLSGRVGRVLYERVGMSVQLRRRRTDAIVNPIFAGPTHGARRIVTVIHDLYFLTTPEFVEPRRRRYLEYIIPRMTRASDAIVAISEFTAGQIRSTWPDAAGKVAVIHSAARTLPPGPPYAADRPYVLFVGVALPNKDVETVVAAIAHLRGEGRDVDLIHVGHDPEGLMAASIAAHDAEGYVRRFNGADDAALASFYRGAVALAVASLTEGFCLPVLEAQSVGTPVCTTACGALAEVAGDGGLYFQPRQPEQLARHIATLLDDDATRAAWGERALANAARFSWDRTAAGVLEQALG